MPISSSFASISVFSKFDVSIANVLLESVFMIIQNCNLLIGVRILDISFIICTYCPFYSEGRWLPFCLSSV